MIIGYQTIIIPSPDCLAQHRSLLQDRFFAMLLPPARPGLVTYALVFVLRFCSASHPVCSTGIYGVPNYKDCLSAWESMPFALKPSADAVSKRYELWSEPQYLRPPFTAVSNRYRPQPINQLPKIWRYGVLIRFPLTTHVS